MKTESKYIEYEVKKPSLIILLLGQLRLISIAQMQKASKACLTKWPAIQKLLNRYLQGNTWMQFKFIIEKNFPSKKGKLDEVEEEYKESINFLNSLMEAAGPIFSALEDKFKKVPEDRKSALKVKLVTLVVETQN